jgi:hypothetical protein
MPKQIATEPLMPSDEADRKNFGFVPSKAELEPMTPMDEEDVAPDPMPEDEDEHE